MLDEIIGEGWSLLGVNMPPSAWASRAWAGLASLSARTADVWLDDRLPGGQPRRPTLVDVDSGMAAEFESYRGRFVLVRPDRFVAAACDPGGIDDMVRGVSGWLEGDPASGVGDNGRNVANAVHSLGGATTLSS
jgi:3-(3-hydroxy-phenyl)propionate hydroxylase